MHFANNLVAGTHHQQPTAITIIRYWFNLSVPLTNDFDQGKLPSLTLVWDSLPLWPVKHARTCCYKPEMDLQMIHHRHRLWNSKIQLLSELLLRKAVIERFVRNPQGSLSAMRMPTGAFTRQPSGH